LNNFNATFKNRDDNNNNYSSKSTVKQLKLEEVGKTVKKLTQTDFNDAYLKLIAGDCVYSLTFYIKLNTQLS